MSDPRLIPADEAKRMREAATPGPWRWKTGEKVAYRNELIGADDPAILACGALRYPDEPDADLIAAAPSLAHTVAHQAARIAELESELHAVAQHDLAQGCKLRAKTVEADRVRTELEALRDCYRHREARSRERLESATDEREQSYLTRFAHMHRRTHEALTRILDGRNTE